MIAYCIHCGASVPNEAVICNGEILPSKYTRCGNCGKLAGVKDEQVKGDNFVELVDKKGEVTIKDGKIS